MAVKDTESRNENEKRLDDAYWSLWKAQRIIEQALSKINDASFALGTGKEIDLSQTKESIADFTNVAQGFLANAELILTKETIQK